MSMSEMRDPIHLGEAAPDFRLPTADGQGTVSLADYRGRSPVFLALLVGLWCPFCRRQIARIGATEGKLKARGVESVGIVATAPENAQLYFKFRPTRLRLGADPELSTHRAYGIPKPAIDAAAMEVLAATRINPTGELPTALAGDGCRGCAGQPRGLRGVGARRRRQGAADRPAESPVPDRPRRHRALGQYRMCQRRPGWPRPVSQRRGNFRSRAGAAELTQEGTSLGSRSGDRRLPLRVDPSRSDRRSGR